MDYAEELTKAEALLDVEDFGHALHHACGALSVQPNAPEVLDVLDLIAEEIDVEETLKDETFLGAHAARARVLAARGELDDAIGIVGALVQGFPELGLEHWLAEWAPRLPGTSLDLRAAHTVFATALQMGLGRLRLLPTEREVVLPFATFARAVVQTQEGSQEGGLHAGASGVVRRSGDFGSALALADRAIELGEEVLGGIARGLALRALERPQEADAAFERVRVASGDEALRAERARALAEAGRFEEALVQQCDSGADDPESKTTTAWLEGCRDGDADALALSLDTIRRRATHGWIPLPTDASSQAIVGVPDDAKVTTMTVTNLEAPSVRLALALAFAGGDLDGLQYSYGDVPEPDPRDPWRTPVFVEPWRREGELCVPAYDPPPVEVVEAVRRLAASPPDLVDWWDRAASLAKTLGAEARDGLIGALVHPPLPEPTSNRELPAAMFHAQVAATMLLVRLPDKMRWGASKRRELLVSLLRGPQDWLTSAAVLVSVEVALHEPASFDEIRRELAELSFALPTTGHATFADALIEAAHRLPLFSLQARDEVAGWLRPLDEGPEEHAAERATPPATSEDRAWVPWVLAGVGMLILALVLVFLR